MIGKEIFISTQAMSEIYSALAKNGIGHEAIAAFPQAGRQRTEMAFEGFPSRLLRPKKGNYLPQRSGCYDLSPEGAA
uniref:Uncharacterized protein n=1 Tax=Candidatus Kentrum sp. DK TaxID=2126562 RepID=A0A450SSQ3_9GAMM|nr:MAG: hypothetical protein BECKDK2373C_GA0170839_100813 [Candidatus Kentron sp. DK]VFJ57107.1 MAG: hypothetical protein BECKDK2373B_GA0170837_106313 [Candidatus Kentron sp. DK]